MDTIGKGELEAARYDRCAVFGRVMVVESEYDNQVQVARDHLLVFVGGAPVHYFFLQMTIYFDLLKIG